MKIYELAIVLLGCAVWTAITTALGLPSVVSLLVGFAIGWIVARCFSKLRG